MLPQTGYCVPLRGILDSDASKAFYKNTHFFPLAQYHAEEKRNTQACLREENSAKTKHE